MNMRTLSLAGAAAMAVALILSGSSFAQTNQPEEMRLALPDARAIASSPALGVASAADTTWVGHRHNASGTYWQIGTASSRFADGGSWTFDDPVHGDSLQGWWPIRNEMVGTAGLTLSDDQRPWWALDNGNQVNYVLEAAPAHRRTFGVVGVWHADAGNTGAGAGQGVGWTPLSGTASAWCGLRRHGDLSHVDPITGNAFNADVLQFNLRSGSGAGVTVGTSRLMPGYGGQWDQMLYRDIDLSADPGSSLALSFRVKTRMSTSFSTDARMRTGWFDKDPLTIVAGNFISSSAAGVNAPRDSFMVYVGAPVDSLFRATDNSVHPVYDPQRRWFDEVIRVNEPALPHHELYSVAGDHDEMVNVTIPNSVIAPLLAASGNRLRLVFRNKTNIGFDDETGSQSGAYSSGGQGAAIVDDVIANGVTIGDFESPGDIDNNVSVSATAAWKSTGKPPGHFFHVHDLSSLQFEDVCGPIGSATSKCHMSGAVISGGDHDFNEAGSGPFGTPEQERWDGVVSPTICLATSGTSMPNAWGLTGAQVSPGSEIDVAYDIYTGIFDPFSGGSLWRFGFQSYPARQADGTPCWGEIRYPGFIIFNPDKVCYADVESATKNGLLVTSNSTGLPDSIRVFIGKRQECYRFGLSYGCSPTDGAYWDNIALGIVTPAPPATISVPLTGWLQDTFPFNENNGLPGTAAFDTCAALIQSGLNIAQSTSTNFRFDVPGDTLTATAVGNQVRLDLVFRIYPGPGNYVTAGNRASGLRRVPTSTTAVTSLAAGDSSFWAQYLANNGAYGTPGGHGASWNVNVWNSARCDTAEINLWPIQGRALGGPVVGTFASMYHESDPKFTTLGLRKNRCWLKDPTAPVNYINTTCDLSQTIGNWPAAAGYVPELAGNPGVTLEYTKIIPDGLLTAGSHIEYFLRRTDLDGPPSAFRMVPDTTRVYPQSDEGSLDGHRWEEMNVLPDMWKKAQYGGFGLACMLFVDHADRRGNELAWVSIADSLGFTRSNKYGAHNGWFSLYGRDVNDPAGFVAANGGQAGTVWDLYNVKGGESFGDASGTIGSRRSNRAPSNVDFKWSHQGPTQAMLDAYYGMVMMFTGDLSSGVIGPFANRSADDAGILRDFLGYGTQSYPKNVFAMGSGFASDAENGEESADLLHSYFKASLADSRYLDEIGPGYSTYQLHPTSALSPSGNYYGLRSRCDASSDVLTPLAGGVVIDNYSPTGVGPFSPASVYFDGNPPTGENWRATIAGWDLNDLTSPFGDDTRARLTYILDTFNSPYFLTTNPCLPFWGDGFYAGVSPPPAATNFMRLAGNPMTSSASTVQFGLVTADRVEAHVYDVSGRLVRTLADRRFPAGQHQLVWDGADDRGVRLARGVYFVRLRYQQSGFESAKKLVMIR